MLEEMIRINETDDISSSDEGDIVMNGILSLVMIIY